MIRLSAAALVLALAGPALAQPPPAAPPSAAAPAADLKTEMGEIDGAAFRTDMPAKWNHGALSKAEVAAAFDALVAWSKGRAGAATGAAR